MIIEGILSAVMSLVNMLISAIPSSTFEMIEYNSTLMTLLGWALYIFPRDVFVVGVANIIVVMTVTFGHSLINFILRVIGAFT